MGNILLVFIVILKIISRTSDEENFKAIDETLKQLEMQLYETFKASFCYVKCISFPNYDSGTWVDNVLEPKGLLDFDAAIKQLRVRELFTFPKYITLC